MILWNSLSYEECMKKLKNDEVLRKNVINIGIAVELDYLFDNSILGNDLDESLGKYLTDEEKSDIFADTLLKYMATSYDCSYLELIKDSVTNFINKAMGKEDDPFYNYDEAYESYIKFKKGEV